jgi:XTP/dITP diphosphohydrolase
MKTFFIATSNLGKQREIAKFAELYGDGVQVVFPNATTEMNVDESGSTFAENALLKAQAYQRALRDDSFYYVGDDSGIIIPALGNKPGVFTRRWAGYEMTDEEIPRYCLEQMKGLRGDDRKAIFETVLAVITPQGEIKYFHGQMPGHILEEPTDAEPQPGFPFRTIFWVDGFNIPIYKLHALSTKERNGFLTHREDAFKQLFADDK